MEALIPKGPRMLNFSLFFVSFAPFVVSPRMRKRRTAAAEVARATKAAPLFRIYGFPERQLLQAPRRLPFPPRSVARVKPSPTANAGCGQTDSSAVASAT